MHEMSMMVKMANNTLRTKKKGLLRASEQSSPGKGGGLLHQFGASDRKTPDAASTFASIPQTLTLLNGKEVHIVTDKKGPAGSLPQLLLSAETDEEKLDSLFIAIYGSYPTEKERSKFLPYMQSTNQTKILAKAMLNSKRFLFLK